MASNFAACSVRQKIEPKSIPEILALSKLVMSKSLQGLSANKVRQLHEKYLALDCCFCTKLLHLRKFFGGHARQSLEVAIQMALMGKPAGDRHL